MITYKEFQPTAFDATGLGLPDRQDWLVGPVSRTRDSGPLEESNFESFISVLGGESDDLEVHRFGHWGPGWFEIILINPNSELVDQAKSLADSLEDCPILDEEDYSQREHEEAESVWRNCYDAKERVEYIRQHRHQFDFNSFADLRSCVNGDHFCGYLSELLG